MNFKLQIIFVSLSFIALWGCSTGDLKEENQNKSLLKEESQNKSLLFFKSINSVEPKISELILLPNIQFRNNMFLTQSSFELERQDSTIFQAFKSSNLFKKVSMGKKSSKDAKVWKADIKILKEEFSNRDIANFYIKLNFVRPDETKTKEISKYGNEANPTHLAILEILYEFVKTGEISEF